MKFVKEIRVNEKYSIVVDAVNYTGIRKLRLSVPRENGYVFYKDGSGNVISLARLITATVDENLVVWHKNGNHLDFRLSNLEVITKGERMKRIRTANKPVKGSPRTGEKHISWLEKDNRYRVDVVDKEGKHHTKRFKVEQFEDAKKYRDQLVQLYIA